MTSKQTFEFLDHEFFYDELSEKQDRLFRAVVELEAGNSDEAHSQLIEALKIEMGIND